MARKTEAQHKKLAGLLAGPVSKKEITIQEALLDSGYSELQSRKGLAAVPDTVLRMLPRNAKRLIKLGAIDPKVQEHLVRGRLADNVIKGKDGGAMSAKILGSDKRLSMWQP